jgi:hypothetical protein
MRRPSGWRSWTGPSDPSSGLSFESDDVEREYRELSERGVEFAKPPKKESWGTSAIFMDAEGNSFVLSSR